MRKKAVSIPLIAVSSSTGNTRIVAHALADEIDSSVYVDLSKAEVDEKLLQEGNPVVLCFWCDKGKAPEATIELAKRLTDKRIACFATLGGNPESEQAKVWMAKTARELTELGENNELVTTFMCRGRISDEIFNLMTKMAGGVVSPERLKTKQMSDAHPDKVDVINAVAAYRKAFCS